jgi:hypothetical protein
LTTIMENQRRRGSRPRPAGEVRGVPKREDLRSVLVIGSGPIVIGQAWVPE